MKKIALKILRLYQLTFSSLVGGCCRFQPSCSEYAKQAIQIHGFWKGSFLTLKRLLKCHPWGGSGYDPVPPKNHFK